MTNVYTAWLHKHEFDEIETLDIVDANAGSHGQPFATNFNPEINIREITQEGRYWENNSWKKTEPLSVKRSFDFPEGIGPMNIYLLYHEELESIAKHFPKLKRARFWMTFSQNYLNHLRILGNVGMTRIDPVRFQGQDIVPIQFLKALLPDPASLGPLTKGRTCIGVVATGTKDGKRKTSFIYNICDHEACYREVKSQAISYTTGVPAAVGAEMMLTGKWRGKGVFNMEQFDPDPFLEVIGPRGLPWKVVKLDAPMELSWTARRLPSPCFVVDEVAVEENLKAIEQGSGSQWREGAGRAEGLLDVEPRAARRQIPVGHLRERRARGQARARALRRRGAHLLGRLLARPT